MTLELTARQNKYLSVVKKAFNIHDAEGNVFPYEPMHYQEEFHADCVACAPKVVNRITRKCRGTGASVAVAIDTVMCAKIYEHARFPVASISMETGEGMIDWCLFLADNAKIEFGRDKSVDSKVRFPLNNTEIFRIPGGRPKVLRNLRTFFLTYDEFAHCDYQADLLSAGRRTLSEGGQHNILSTPGTNVDSYWTILKKYKELGFRLYDWLIFWEKWFDKRLTIIEQIDQEYLEYYEASEFKKMRELCNAAWDKGLWKTDTLELEAVDVNAKYYGLWPEDRGLIPIAPWLDLRKLEEDRILNVISFMRENMGSVEEEAGALLPLTLLEPPDGICRIPVLHRTPSLIATKLFDPDFTHQMVMGFDFGGKVHMGACSVLEETGEINGIPRYTHVLTETFVQSEICKDEKGFYLNELDRLKEICNQFPGIWIIGIDETGPGVTFGELAQRELGNKAYVVLINMGDTVPVGRIQSKTFKVKMNRQIASELRIAALNNELELMNDRNLIMDLNLPQIEDLSGKVRRESSGDQVLNHADRFWSIGCAMIARRFVTRATIKAISKETPIIQGIDPRLKGKRILEQAGAPVQQVISMKGRGMRRLKRR